MTKLQKIRKKWPALVREAGPWFAAFIINILIVGWAYSFVEGVGPISGPWWGLVTGSTTGYGDLYPHSTAARGLAAYLILSSIIIDRIFSAKLVTVMVEEPNLYSHNEQERDEALSALNYALNCKIAERLGIDTLDMPETSRYLTALNAVKEEEELQ